MRSIVSATLVALMVAALAATAEARKPPRGGGPGGAGGPPPHRGGPPPGPGAGEIEELADELGLKPAQRKAIRDIADDAHKQQVKIRAEIEVLEVDLRRELDADEPDEAKVVTLIDKITALEATAKKTHLLAWLKIRKVLTKEQRKKLQEIHEKRRREWRERQGDGPPDPPPPPPPPR